MENIPVIFEYEENEYFAHLRIVSGNGSTNGSFHLMSDDMYCGHLFHSESYGWQYHGNTFDGIADQLAEFIDVHRPFS